MASMARLIAAGKDTAIPTLSQLPVKMKTLFRRRVAMFVLVTCMLCLNSSCQLLAPVAPVLSTPLTMLGAAISTVSANPLGTAAAAAAL